MVHDFQFTFERPEKCSKSRLVQVPVREINNKHIKSIGEVGQKIREEEIKRQSKKKPENITEEAKTSETSKEPSREPTKGPEPRTEPESEPKVEQKVEQI